MNKRKQVIEVVPYNKHWPSLFESESNLVKPIFGDNFKAIYHVGSTSVPGLSAKPTIDILLDVNNVEQIDQHNSEMQNLGYEAWGEYKIPGRRFFVKGDEKRTHHIHAFETGSEHIHRHIVFRDYLIAHPGVAKEYEALKLDLAKRFKHNRRAYVMAKTDYVLETEAKALEWAKS